jgi:uncharacterized protein YeeX (DUF496 family)
MVLTLLTDKKQRHNEECLNLIKELPNNMYKTMNVPGIRGIVPSEFIPYAQTVDQASYVKILVRLHEAAY